MESSSLMLTIAQLIVGVAGFSAIVVTLNPTPIREWDDTDKFNLRLLIQVSIFAILFSIVPSILAVSLEPSAVWKYGLWAYGLLHVADVSFFLFNMTRETPVVFRNIAICGLFVALAQVGIAWLGNDTSRETMYLFTLTWHLGVVLMAFILLLYQVRRTS
jgi:hypothetical protein